MKLMCNEKIDAVYINITHGSLVRNTSGVNVSEHTGKMLLQ